MTYLLALDSMGEEWRGAQRLLLTVAGEYVTETQYWGDYEAEQLAERLSQPTITPARGRDIIANQVRSVVAYTLVYCQAVESLAAVAVPPRAAVLRCLLAEVERASSHLETLRGIFDTLGLAHDSRHAERLHMQIAQIGHAVAGITEMAHMCILGGIAHDLDAQTHAHIRETIAAILRELFDMAERMIEQHGLLRRTVGIGVLPLSAAEQFGVRGPFARASGLEVDARQDAPYAAYERLHVRPVVQQGGDVQSRLMVLLLEALESVNLIIEAIELLPEGEWHTPMPTTIGAGRGRSVVESPRGLVRLTLDWDGEGLTSVTMDAPRQLDRLVARALLVDALVDDVAVIARSTDTCLRC